MMSAGFHRIVVAPAALALVWAAVSTCSGSSSSDSPSGPPSPPPAVASVDVTPVSADLEPGDTVDLNAVPRAADGSALDRDVNWSSSDEDVATVDSEGVVTAEAAGSANITATSENASGTASIRVFVPVASVDVETPAQGLIVGGTVQLTATARAADGTALDRTLEWSSSDEAVATVDGSGLVTALAPGEVEITATASGAAGSLVAAEASGSVSLVVTIDWKAFEGNWLGQWTNTTFGSTGAITATLSIDMATLEATLLLDVDGPVFGTQDPMPFTVVSPLGSTSITVDYDAPLHGPVRLTLEPGDFTVSSVIVPAGGIEAWSYTGTNTPASHTASFTVDFSGGGSANGTVSVQKQ